MQSSFMPAAPPRTRLLPEDASGDLLRPKLARKKSAGGEDPVQLAGRLRVPGRSLPKVLRNAPCGAADGVNINQWRNRRDDCGPDATT